MYRRRLTQYPFGLLESVEYIDQVEADDEHPDVYGTALDDDEDRPQQRP